MLDELAVVVELVLVDVEAVVVVEDEESEPELALMPSGGGGGGGPIMPPGPLALSESDKAEANSVSLTLPSPSVSIAANNSDAPLEDDVADVEAVELLDVFDVLALADAVLVGRPSALEISSRAVSSSLSLTEPSPFASIAANSWAKASEEDVSLEALVLDDESVLDESVDESNDINVSGAKPEALGVELVIDSNVVDEIVLDEPARDENRFSASDSLTSSGRPATNSDLDRLPLLSVSSLLKSWLDVR